MTVPEALAGKWFMRPSSTAVVASLLDLRRNCADLPFGHKASRQDKIKLLSRSDIFFRMRSASDGGPFLNPFETKNKHRDQRSILKNWFVPLPDEANLSERLFLGAKGDQGVLVNQEHHYLVFGLEMGQGVGTIYQRLSFLSRHLEQIAPFAVSLEWGYLGPQLACLGTAMRARMVIHLPALSQDADFEALSAALAEEGQELNRFAPSEAYLDAGLFMIGNEVTLGVSEEEVLIKLDESANLLLHYEELAAKAIAASDSGAMDDRVWRALGLLKSSRKMTEQEALGHMLSLRLGIAAGILDATCYPYLNGVFFALSDEILFEVLSDGKDSGAFDAEASRATFLREVFGSVAGHL